ncbi:MAG: hypothetical protein OEM41_03540 [Ignavibacteria bacterium]|nr:hypothetical protein [Ignavibacteria bacterium]
MLLLPACDEGLGPLNEPSGFSGVIHFTNWPSPDSVQELRLVAFTEFPSDSSGILLALLEGRAVVYPPVGASGFRKFVDTLQYAFTTQGTNLQVRPYNYVIIAQRYGSNFFADWQPAGVYTTQPNSFDPAPVRILLHRITPNIDIEVDFSNPPPKPWR